MGHAQISAMAAFHWLDEDVSPGSAVVLWSLERAQIFVDWAWMGPLPRLGEGRI